MGKPRLIILVRHAQSEGNKNRSIHQTVPDHRVKLTPDGHRQACAAGEKLRDMLLPTDTVQFYVSPYMRTRQTCEEMMKSLGDFPSRVYEEPRIREQDFGNFQPCSDEMERMWHERAAYGHFFYRIPNGESAADAYDRVSGFNESLWRQFADEDFASVLVLVTHGLMTRIFLMKWYHFSVEHFEDLRNVDHCEFVVMRKIQETGKYLLENKMRTWSDLRKQREKEAEEAANKLGNFSITAEQDVRKNEIIQKAALAERPLANGSKLNPNSKDFLNTLGIGLWGCANGCSHGKRGLRSGSGTPMDMASGRSSRAGSEHESDDEDAKGRISIGSIDGIGGFYALKSPKEVDARARDAQDEVTGDFSPVAPPSPPVIVATTVEETLRQQGKINGVPGGSVESDVR